MMQFRLVPSDEFHDERGPFEPPITLGRSLDAGEQVNDRWVSRLHCQFEERDGDLVVRDLESTHGTYVNGKRVNEKVVTPGDELSLGLARYQIMWGETELVQYDNELQSSQ